MHRHLCNPEQEWAKFAKSKTARHKLAKFLKEHAHLLPDHLKMPPAGLSDRAVDGRAAPAGGECTMWLDVEGIEGPGLLAELARIIAKHGHNVQVGALPADRREAAWASPVAVGICTPPNSV